MDEVTELEALSVEQLIEMVRGRTWRPVWRARTSPGNERLTPAPELDHVPINCQGSCQGQTAERRQEEGP